MSRMLGGSSHRSWHTLVTYLPEPTHSQAPLAIESKRCQSDPFTSN